MSEKSLTLFEVAAQYHAQATALYDMDLDEQTLADTLESISGDVELKATNIGYVIRNIESLVASMRAAEADMAARRKAAEARIERVKHYLLDGLQLAGIKKVTGPAFSVTVRDNPPSVVIDEQGLIPAEYWRQPEPPPPAVDKVKLKEVLKSGVEIPGAHLSSTKRVEIK